jgi:hypothetical protein
VRLFPLRNLKCRELIHYLMTCFPAARRALAYQPPRAQEAHRILPSDG